MVFLFGFPFLFSFLLERYNTVPSTMTLKNHYENLFVQNCFFFFCNNGWNVPSEHTKIKTQSVTMGPTNKTQWIGFKLHQKESKRTSFLSRLPNESVLSFLFCFVSFYKRYNRFLHQIVFWISYEFCFFFTWFLDISVSQNQKIPFFATLDVPSEQKKTHNHRVTEITMVQQTNKKK